MRCSRFLRNVRKLIADPSLIDCPAGVGTAQVFRNVVTEEEEQIMYEEMAPLLKSFGQPVMSTTDMLLKATSSDGKKRTVQRVICDLHGGADTGLTDLYDAMQKKVRKLPGFGYTPRTFNAISRVAQGVGIDYVIDTARINEYYAPGCDMHVDNPSVGPTWGILSLFAPSVMTFDEETTGRTAYALLPPRSFLLLSGELRWGWRHGVQYDTPHRFKGRDIHPDYRISLVVWKLHKGLLNTTDVAQQIIKAKMEEDAVKGKKSGPVLGGDLPEPHDKAKNSRESLAAQHERLKNDLKSFTPKLEQIAKKGNQITDDEARKILGLPDEVTQEGVSKEFDELTEKAKKCADMLRR
eukprot:PhF_6_TR39030/c0_g1_i1/m.58416